MSDYLENLYQEYRAARDAYYNCPPWRPFKCWRLWREAMHLGHRYIKEFDSRDAGGAS